MQHFYHFWGEIVLGFWRVYSQLLPATGETLPDPAHIMIPVSFLPPLLHIFSSLSHYMQFVEGPKWRDRAGIDGPLLRAAFPDASISTSDHWEDLIKLDRTVVFERAAVINRKTAHRQ